MVKWSQLALTSTALGVGAGSSEGILLISAFSTTPHPPDKSIAPSPVSGVCFLGLTPPQASAKASTSFCHLSHSSWKEFGTARSSQLRRQECRSRHYLKGLLKTWGFTRQRAPTSLIKYHYSNNLKIYKRHQSSDTGDGVGRKLVHGLSSILDVDKHFHSKSALWT